MRIAQVYWRAAADTSGTGKVANSTMAMAVDRRVWIPRIEANQDTNFLLVEVPSVFNVPVPVVDSVVIDGRREWRPILYTFCAPDVEASIHIDTHSELRISEKAAAGADYFPQVIFDPAPRWMELLLVITAKLYEQQLDNEPHRAFSKLECFLQYEDVLGEHLAPGEFERQTFAIAIRWPAWESKGFSWDERAADLLEQTNTRFSPGGLNNTDALEKRCRRLGLKKGDAR
jgi:hypothetical protein